jgi:hypothetical protein
MATLPPFFAKGTAKGLNVDIRSSGFDVGDGTYDQFSDFMAALSGSIDFLGNHSTFKLNLQLTDQNPGAQSGPAKITFGTSADANARYTVNGAVLHIDARFGGKAETIEIKPISGGKVTQVAFAGEQNRTVKLVRK